MGYCAKGHADDYRYQGLDAGNVYYEECRACGETWIFGERDAQWAAVFRTALACGRSWKTAHRMADEYPTSVPYPMVGAFYTSRGAAESERYERERERAARDQAAERKAR